MTIHVTNPQTVSFPRLDDPKEFERIRLETEKMLRREQQSRLARPSFRLLKTQRRVKLRKLPG